MHARGWVQHAYLSSVPPPPVSDSGGKLLPPFPTTVCPSCHVVRRKGTGVGFLASRQAIFDNKIGRGLFLTIPLDRGLYL